jgi:exodeoxyribonuclease VII large subunit
MGIQYTLFFLLFNRAAKKENCYINSSFHTGVRFRMQQSASRVQVPLTITEVTRRIKLALETGFPALQVVGEVSNFKHHSSGHLYFTLKDEGAQLSAVMWRSRVPSLTFTPADGMKVVATGRLSVYEVRGSYQIDVSALRPMGTGDLQIAFERLKEKLGAEGLFDLSRKRILPRYPLRIGVITSPTGAVLHDMKHVFDRRFPAVELVLAPTRVQGAGASDDIAQAIRDLNRLGGLDILILARGGGSLEDLWAFNEEQVARAIAASQIPVVSAVGHEVDVTIADFVADLRAPTPTAAAEMVVRDRTAILELLRNSCATMHESFVSRLRHHREHIRHLLKSHALNRPVDLLHRHAQHVDELSRSMSTALTHRSALAETHARALIDRLAALDPQRVLKRGYAIVRRRGTVVASRTDVHPRDRVDITFHDGAVSSIID